MLGFPLDDIISHWSKLIEGLSTSSGKFYEAVERGLARRKLPQARIKRVNWTEGGVLSPNREYLRIEGSGFIYDICAAPFGTGFFFSEWLTRRRPGWVLLTLVLFLAFTWLISRGLAEVFAAGFRAAPPGFFTVALAIVLRNPLTLGALSILVAMTSVGFLSRAGSPEVGEALCAVPVLGWIYGRWFAPVTFYRLDTAAMFRATVHAAVLEAIDDLTTQKGIRALTEEERQPVHELVPSMP